MIEIKLLIADNMKKQQKLYDDYFTALDFSGTDNKFIFTIEVANSGEEAYDKIINNTYDFIIFEQFIPKGIGTEVVENLRTINANIPPCVLITKKGSEELAVKALRAGFVNYWRKENLELKDLENFIRSCLHIEKNGNLLDFQYKELISDQEYDFAFLKIELLQNNRSFSALYTRKELDKIFSNIRNFFDRKITDSGGEVWASKSTSFLASFHKGDFEKTAVQCAIELFSGLSLYNIANKKRAEADLVFKIAVHRGLARFEEKREIIISKDLNYTAHMLKDTKGYNLIISEDVYNVLNNKLKSNFLESHDFNDKQIYRYAF